MFVYEIVSVICLASLVFGAFYVAVKLVHPKGKNRSEKREQRILYLRSFRKGQCVLVFVPMIVLYVIGGIKQGFPVYKVFLESLAKTFSVITLKFETGIIDSLLETCRIYKFTVYFTFYMVAVNACVFGISMFIQRFSFSRNNRRRAKTVSGRLKEETCIIYGNNPHSEMIYFSDAGACFPKRYIVADFANSGDDRLFSKGVRYASFKGSRKETDILSRYMKAMDDPKQKRLSVIINFENDKDNIELCRSFSELVSTKAEQIKGIRKKEKQLKSAVSVTEEEKEQLELEKARLSKLSIFVLGKDNIDSIYRDIERKSCGYIYCLNRYRLISRRFLWNHPFTDFMTDSHINKKDALLKSGTTISVLMVGFGKTNTRLFSDLIAGNQFAVEDKVSKCRPLIADYHIYDCRKDLHTKDLNHDFFRYQEFCNEHEKDRDKYLPFADLPAKEHLVPGCDINSKGFYESVHAALGKNESDLNFLFIAYGDDLENIELAGKMRSKKKEWGIRNLTIFVKTDSFGNLIPEPDPDSGTEIIPYGEDSEVYSLKNIISEDLYTIAVNADKAYWRAKNKGNLYARIWDWHSSEKNHIDRQSSFYAGLNLKNKYGLLGLDFDKIMNSNDVKQFSSAYNDTARNNLAYQEHLRWNAFMICNGYVPASKSQILDEKGKGKNHAERRHGNLTTQEGLKEFQDMLCGKYGEHEEFNVVKYDYELMDESCSLFPEQQE